MCVCEVASVMCDSAPLWTVLSQAPLSVGFSRQVYWSGLPCSSPGDLPDLGIESVSPASPALQADSLLLSHWGSHFPEYGWFYFGFYSASALIGPDFMKKQPAGFRILSHASCHPIL